jgi:hypothetical protein
MFEADVRNKRTFHDPAVKWGIAGWIEISFCKALEYEAIAAMELGSSMKVMITRVLPA